MTKMNRLAITVAILLTATCAATAVFGIMTDLTGHWAAPLIAALQVRGIAQGDETGRFNPDAPLSRAQAAKLLIASLDNEADAKLLAAYPSRFSDIPVTHWARGYVEALAETAIVEGYPDGSFGPAESVSRAQMAVMLVRAVGLTEQARLRRMEPTAFTDDAQIPEWARGAVSVAAAVGLLNGFEDGSFRPAQSVTRAEGSVALLRLTEFKGTAFHLTGTLVRFNPIDLRGVVRDALGQQTAFTMLSTAPFYRAGQQVSPQQISPLDQVWIVLGPNGTGIFLEARFKDLLGTGLSVQGRSVSVRLAGGESQTFPLQPGAPIFVNGRQAPLDEAQGAPQVYLALDVLTDEIRFLDAVKAPISGIVSDISPTTSILSVNVGVQIKSWPVSSDARLFREGQRIALSELNKGERVRLALDADGAVTYLQSGG